MLADIDYHSKSTSELTEDELNQCSELYSNHYGIYSSDAPDGKAGRRVRMSPSFYRKYFFNENYRVALAVKDGVVIGQAFYFREKIGEDTITWVLQLVVHSDYRRAGIGSRLLHSIWGFSNDSAWGLATANPFTVKTLEGTTLRHVYPKEMMKHEALVREICSRVSYISGLELDDTKSIADTSFYVDADGMNEQLLFKKFGDGWVLGALPPGHEWVAFTFRDQPFDTDFARELNGLISFSEDRLREAYSRMDMDNHPWAKHASKEMQSIESLCGSFDGLKVLDAGCGRGRHAMEIARSCPHAEIHGIDFSETNIESAKGKIGNLDNVSFEVCDLREYHPEERYDVILCLYDVIGSLPEEEDNRRILENLASSCKTDGLLVLSVMNMELTEHLVKKTNVGDVHADPGILFNLPPSNVMHKSGDIFDPEYFAIDSATGLVYRKEQFDDDSALPAEYVIRDKRYRAEEISNLVSESGFEVVGVRYVRAGRWDEPLDAIDPKAKEILVIAHRR